VECVKPEQIRMAHSVTRDRHGERGRIAIHAARDFGERGDATLDHKPRDQRASESGVASARARQDVVAGEAERAAHIVDDLIERKARAICARRMRQVRNEISAADDPQVGVAALVE